MNKKKVTIPEGIFGEISGPIVIVGFGSIGKGTLPLLERHFKYDKSRMVIIDPSTLNKHIADKHGVTFIQKAITKENYKEVLKPLLTQGGGTGFCVNLSVDVSSRDIMTFCQDIGSFYIDTVVEPWPGMYFDKNLTPAARSNYALRETVLKARAEKPGGITAVSCVGANPGMVSWFVKQALVNLADDLKIPYTTPTTQAQWASLMQKVGVKGIHIAERDTQVSKRAKPMNTFVNTWSVEGFISEGNQPAELGWGTHENWMPSNGVAHVDGCQAAIYLQQAGAMTRVRSWCPTPGAQFGRLVTHNESISIADYFTLKNGNKVEYRPTCHYAYSPCNDALLALEEMFGHGDAQKEHHILDEKEVTDGIDELGVLLYGHAKNAYWYGSQLGIEETRTLAPYQNATALQVTSAVIAGMVWALENPEEGIVEADEMDFKRCLEIQKPYLGPVNGYFTNWTPLDGRPGLFPEDIDTTDPWQFKNILVR